MIRIAELLPPRPTRLWKLVRQCGIDNVVGAMDRHNRLNVPGNPKPWSYESLSRVKTEYESWGFRVGVLESRPPMKKIRLGLAGRDRELDGVCELIRSLGRLGIGVWCYHWMPVFPGIRTDLNVQGRGGALVTAFNHADLEPGPHPEEGEITEQLLWENLEYFLKAVVPVAEQAGVKLAMHPDDPPYSPIRGIPSIMCSKENLQRLIDLVPSSVNGITMCHASIALMGADVPATIRYFGNQNKIFYTHMRDARGSAENFVETFHDDGPTDLVECMKAYRDVRFDGLGRHDHTPTLESDSHAKPGYSTLGRLYAYGYLKGIRDSVYGRPRRPL